MAIQQGSQILNSDLQSLYSDFNTFISNRAAGVISTLAIPAANKKAEASDINDLNTKIVEFQNDEYLGTQASWWVDANVTIGSLITPVTNILTTIDNFSLVACRNKATNNKGENTNHCDANGNHGECCNTNSTNSNCCNTNSTNANCCNTNSTNGNCCNTNGNHGNCCNANGNHGNCCNTNGNNGNQCGNGNNGNYCSNQVFTYYVGKVWQRSGSTARPGKYYGNNYAGTGVVWTPQGGTTPCQNSCGTETGGTNVREYQSMRSCNVTCSYQTHGQQCGNGNHGQGCGNGNHGQGCGNGNHGQGCGNGNHGQGCARGNHGQNCTRGTHGQGCNRGTNGRSCSQGNYGEVCSHTTTIDITCNQATKTNN